MNKALVACALLLAAVVAGFGSLISASDSALAAPQVGTVDTMGNMVRHTGASLDFTCPNGKKFSLTTGNKKGYCGSGVSVAECTDGNGNSARVECNNPASGTNCTGSKGTGECTSH